MQRPGNNLRTTAWKEYEVSSDECYWLTGCVSAEAFVILATNTGPLDASVELLSLSHIPGRDMIGYVAGLYGI